MSKFVDKLQHLSNTSISPIGFRSPVSESKTPGMLLLATLSPLDAKEAEIIAKSNIDGGLIMSQELGAEVVKKIVKAVGKVPLGVLIKDANEEKVDELARSGCDFVVFLTRMPAAILHRKEIGKFLMVEPSLDSGLVKTVNSLDIDGVFLNCGEGSFVTVEHLLLCQRFRELLDKPLIVILPSLVNGDVLRNLWEAEVDGVVIPAEQPEEVFVELRRQINDLPKEAKHGRAKASAILPSYGGGMPVEEEEEEET